MIKTGKNNVRLEIFFSKCYDMRVDSFQKLWVINMLSFFKGKGVKEDGILKCIRLSI